MHYALTNKDINVMRFLKKTNPFNGYDDTWVHPFATAQIRRSNIALTQTFVNNPSVKPYFQLKSEAINFWPESKVMSWNDGIFKIKAINRTNFFEKGYFEAAGQCTF